MFAFLIPYVLKLGIPAKFAKPAIYAALITLAVLALGVAKCTYDHRIIAAHEAKQDAANAKADRKADQKAAEQRRTDDTRLQTETQEIKDAVQKAGSDPAARRAAYYDCVRKQQLARSKHLQPASC